MFHRMPRYMIIYFQCRTGLQNTAATQYINKSQCTSWASPVTGSFAHCVFLVLITGKRLFPSPLHCEPELHHTVATSINEITTAYNPTKQGHSLFLRRTKSLQSLNNVFQTSWELVFIREGIILPMFLKPYYLILTWKKKTRLYYTIQAFFCYI